MTERVCKACGVTYMFGTREICSTCREVGLRPVKSPGKPQPTKAQDSRIDLGMALEELRRALDELVAMPGDMLRYKRDEALREPLARVLLARRFVDNVLRRHRVKVERK